MLRSDALYNTGKIQISKTTLATMRKSNTATTLSVLERLDAAGSPLSEEVASKRELFIFKEVECADYIVGAVGPESHDSPETMIAEVWFTTEGRLLMERLRRERKEASFWVKTWGWLGPVAGFVVGIVSQVVAEYLKGLIGP